jgi:hypothetical protein
MSIHICDFEEGDWCKLSSKSSTFTKEGTTWCIGLDKDCNPISRWNGTDYPLDLEFNVDGLLTEFSCFGDRKYEFNLDSDKNIQIGDYIYIKDLCGIIYYLKISKSTLKNLKQLLCARTCEK